MEISKTNSVYVLARMLEANCHDIPCISRGILHRFGIIPAVIILLDNAVKFKRNKNVL